MLFSKKEEELVIRVTSGNKKTPTIEVFGGDPTGVAEAFNKTKKLVTGRTSRRSK